MKNKLFSARGKTWKLPEVLVFDMTFKKGSSVPQKCFYGCVDFREPKEGEHYLTEATYLAYLALNDMNEKHLVVKPTYFAKEVRGFERDFENPIHAL